MSAGLQLVLSAALAASPPGCSWAHPGANPYRGDPVHALADFQMPDETRRQLRAMMAAHKTTDIVTITRDDILGAQAYADLREMHSGRGQVCHGAVDRSAWAPTRRERGLVYCAGDTCVIVPTICNNVSLVSRKPDRAAVVDEGPIDIEPAAGPPPTPAPPADAPTDTASPLAFIAPADGGAGAPGAPEAPGGGGFPGTGFPGSGSPGGGTNPPCCDTGPVGPGGGGGGGGTSPPVTSPVPETPTAWLLLAGLASMAWRRAGARARARA